MGNRQLIEYGIFQDKSDMRAHVCVNASCVYVFDTQKAAEMLRHRSYKVLSALTKNIVTAKGFIVPALDIPDIKRIDIPASWMRKIKFSERDSTTNKGKKAVTIVQGIIKKGMFPFRAEGIEVEGHQMQLDGLDIIVAFKSRIQVKCDYKGGIGSGCTGNLYLQTHECNPFRQY